MVHPSLIIFNVIRTSLLVANPKKVHQELLPGTLGRQPL